jgi:hypothetical protein
MSKPAGAAEQSQVCRFLRGKINTAETVEETDEITGA